MIASRENQEYVEKNLLQCHMVYHVMNVGLCDEILQANHSSYSMALGGAIWRLHISSVRFEVLTVVL
jgi:hypothetical protein